MANLDTREKRASSVAISFYSMGPSIQAGSSGLDAEDRQIVGYGYSAIAVAAPAAAPDVSGMVMAGGGSVGPNVGHVTVRTLHAKGAPA